MSDRPVLQRELQIWKKNFESRFAASKISAVPTIVPVTAGATVFTELHDVPAVYTSCGGYVVRVNAGATVLEFAELKGTSNQVTVAHNVADITLSLPQNIDTGASPVFVTAKFSNLTDTFVPYHVDDATGLANSPIQVVSGNVGIGMTPTVQLHVATCVIIEDTDSNPFLRIQNKSDVPYDPIVQFAVGLTPSVKFTHGVDDSLNDDLVWCNDDELVNVVEGGTGFGDNLFIMDRANNRVKKHTASSLAYVAKIGSAGSGNDQFSAPYEICYDATYIYIMDRDNHRLVKRLASTLAYVAQIGSYGTGNDNFAYPYGICTDGVHLYICDSNNNRIVKRLCSDLSYVSQQTTYGLTFNSPRVICTDGIYLYITQSSGATGRLIKLKCLDLSAVSYILNDGHINAANLQGICTDGNYLYITNSNNSVDAAIYKYTKALVYDSEYKNTGSGDAQFTGPKEICTDKTYLYICDSGNSRVKKHLKSDYSYVSKIGSYGIGDDQFNDPAGIVVGFLGDARRGKLLKLHEDGSHFEVYPKLSLYNYLLFMEDSVAAANYVGIQSPISIVSYVLTLPGAEPGAKKHFQIDSGNIMSWGQNVDTDGTPSWPHAHLTAAIGIAPLEVISTTLVTNLNADFWDGYQFSDYLDQAVKTISGPTFEHVHVTVATGTAPFVVASTTVTTNLNADLLDGYHESSFVRLTAIAGDIIYGDADPKWTKLAKGNDGQYLKLVAGLPAWAAGGAGGAGDAVTKDVVQTAHGLSVGNVVKISAANAYAKAQANSAANAEAVGLVASLADGDNFVLIRGGYWESTSVPVQVAGTVMYLDPVTAGAMTATAPTTDDLVSKPVGVILESGAKMWVYFDMRGVLLDTWTWLGAENLTDPGADRIVFWDDSESALKWLSLGNSLGFTTTVLDTIQDIRTSAAPQFANLGVGLAALSTVRIRAGAIAASTGSAQGISAAGPTRTVAVDETNYFIALASSSYYADIDSGIIDSGYRMGYDGSALINDVNFQGTLTALYGARFMAGILAAGVSGARTVTNVYCVYASGYAVEGTVTNKYGYYQSGSAFQNYFAGQVYCVENCSALTFTDRTDYPKDIKEAYNAVMSLVGKEGKLDHSKLHPFVKSERHSNEGSEGGRNLSALVSAQNEVIKDLLTRIEVLET